MEAVSNSTVLIALAKLKRLDLLQNIFERVYIPPAVQQELFAGTQQYHAECTLLRDAMRSWLTVREPSGTLDCGLGVGETAALLLCRKSGIPLFLSDDSPARTFAETLGLEPLGTIGIMVLNCQLGKLSREQYRALLNQLVQNGMYLSTDVYQAAMDAVNANEEGTPQKRNREDEG